MSSISPVLSLNQVISALKAIGPRLTEYEEKMIREHGYAFGLPPRNTTTCDLVKWKRDVIDYAKIR